MSAHGFMPAVSPKALKAISRTIRRWTLHPSQRQVPAGSGQGVQSDCKSAEEAQALWAALADRFATCKLVLHPEKTKIVFCKDANRRGDFPNQAFDFLGFSFRARKTVLARNYPRGIGDRPTSFRSPWQNGCVERLIGSIRRECTDHVIVFNAEHLRRILAKYAAYYNEVRTHVSLQKDAPCRRPIERFGDIVAYPILGGLHHRYARI
jgi:hypothetical protein